MRRVATIGLLAAAVLALGAAGLHAATGGWVRVHHPALEGGGSNVYVRDILPAAADEPWLAVGYLVDSDGARAPSAWSSADGVAWTRTAMGPTTSPERRDGPYLVARRGSVAVALGERFDGQLLPAAWFRSAPNTWTALTSPTDPLVRYRGWITALTAGPNEFVAVGVEYFGARTTVSVFTSVDGRSWSDRGVMEPDEGFEPLGVSEANGYIVIVGATPGASADGRIWVLGPGYADWSRIPSGPLGFDGPGDQVVTTVAWNGARGFVAGGSIVTGGRETPTMWRSADGLAWTRLPAGAVASDGRNALVQRIVAVGSGFLASGAADGGALLWRSVDGNAWTAIPPPATPSSPGEFVIPASDGGKTLVLAVDDFGSQMHRLSGANWTRADTGSAFPRSSTASELVGVASAGSRVVAIGAGADRRPLVMVSSAGGGWHRRPFSDKTARVVAIDVDRGTFMAVGWRLVAGRARLATWTSKDGTRWHRLGGTAFEPVGAFFDVAAVRNGFVAVALEPSPRGFVTSAWTLTRAGWRDDGVLGLGEPRAICAGPHGVTAVSVRGGGLQLRVVAWTRRLSGPWPHEPEVVATSGASGERCADAPSGTIVVGRRVGSSAVLWRRARPGSPWSELVLAQTSPASSMGDVVREGSGFIATGSYGGRGQADLAVWRSPDGVGWGWLGLLDPVFTESGYQEGLGVVRVGDRIVVVGRHGAGSAGLWLGPVPPGPPGDEPGP